jgi:Type III restriction enzyme, res subunit
MRPALRPYQVDVIARVDAEVDAGRRRVLDEAHHVPARTYRWILEQYPGAAVIGLTATPCRGDGRGLGGIFDTLVEAPQVAELIALGFLVPTKVFAPYVPDTAVTGPRHAVTVDAVIELAVKLAADRLPVFPCAASKAPMCPTSAHKKPATALVGAVAGGLED